MCAGGPVTDVGGLPLWPPTVLLEAASLMESGAHQLCQAGWPAAPGMLSHVPSQQQDYWCSVPRPSLLHGCRDAWHVLMFVGQAL